MPDCPANIRETKIAVGFVPQPDLITVNTPAEMWSFTKTNATTMAVTPVTETDAADIGKGDEFPTQVFPVSMDATVTVEKYASSEFLAWVFAFATGNVVKTAAGTGWKYCAEPSDPAVACLNLPPFTFAEQIRTPPESVIDQASLGMVVNDFTLTMESGPGRSNCRVTTNLIGTGNVVTPSNITPWPAVETEHFLNAASAAITIGGIDYVLGGGFISLTFSWNNNVRTDSGYYPGSGVNASGFALRGRMEYNTRVCALSFVARARKGSPELAALLAQTPGACSIKLSGALIGAGPEKHGMDITIPKAVFSAVTTGEADGIVTVNCDVSPLKDTTTGKYVTMCATTTKTGIIAQIEERAKAA
jgi:hypothetical protein